jgi:hypothetical protein
MQENTPNSIFSANFSSKFKDDQYSALEKTLNVQMISGTSKGEMRPTKLWNRKLHPQEPV